MRSVIHYGCHRDVGSRDIQLGRETEILRPLNLAYFAGIELLLLIADLRLGRQRCYHPIAAVGRNAHFRVAHYAPEDRADDPVVRVVTQGAIRRKQYLLFGAAVQIVMQLVIDGAQQLRRRCRGKGDGGGPDRGGGDRRRHSRCLEQVVRKGCLILTRVQHSETIAAGGHLDSDAVERGGGFVDHGDINGGQRSRDEGPDAEEQPLPAGGLQLEIGALLRAIDAITGCHLDLAAGFRLRIAHPQIQQVGGSTAESFAVEYGRVRGGWGWFEQSEGLGPVAVVQRLKIIPYRLLRAKMVRIHDANRDDGGGYGQHQSQQPAGRDPNESGAVFHGIYDTGCGRSAPPSGWPVTSGPSHASSADTSTSTGTPTAVVSRTVSLAIETPVS